MTREKRSWVFNDAGHTVDIPDMNSKSQYKFEIPKEFQVKYTGIQVAIYFICPRRDQAAFTVCSPKLRGFKYS